MKRISLLVIIFYSLIVNVFGQIQYPRVIVSNSITLSGKGDFSDTRDQGKIYRFIENSSSNFKIRTYIKSFSSYNNNSKAGIIIRDASLAQESDGSRMNYGLFCERGKIILQSRSITQGNTAILKTININLPCWLELEKQGSTLYVRYSLDGENSIPIFTSIEVINNAFSNFINYTKALAVGSGVSNIYSSAVFSNYISTTTTPNICTQTPTILSVSKNLGQNTYRVTYSATGSTGFTYAILDSGTEIKIGSIAALFSGYFDIDLGTLLLSDKNYTLRISASNCTGIAEKIFTGSMCGLISGTKIGTKTILSTPYDLYARRFNDKLWLTQALSTNPESFIVRGVNITQTDFVKSWTGNDFSCFQGQTTTFNGFEEPSGFSTPSGYTLSTINGTKIYTAATIATQSCSNGGNFTITNITTTPASTVHAVSFNAQYLSSARVIVKNSSQVIIKDFTQSITAQPQLIQLGLTVSGNYTIQFIGISCNGTSNVYPFTFEAPVIDNTPGQTFFVNFTKRVETELVNGKYSPHLFPTIQTPLSIDPILGKLYPHWTVAWQAEGGNFSRNNRTTVDLGMSFMYDRKPENYQGYGVRCLDYFWESNFSNGAEWVDGIDPVCNKNINTFTSRIPFHQRAISLYGIGSSTDRQQWVVNGTDWVFDKGVESVSSRYLGWGDKVNGKVNTGLANADIEIGLEQGFEYYPKHLAFLLGMGSASQGYVFSQYSAAMNSVGVDLSFYPNDSGVFPTLRKKIDGNNYTDGSGNTVLNNIPLSPDWNPTSKIDISSRGIINKGIIDYPNILPCIEISSTSDMTFHNGQIYARKNGWAYSAGNLSYSASNPIDNTIVDKFGMNRNTNHIIADIICYGDVNKWWSVNKLNNRKVILQSKITCDRANLGLFYEAGFTNQDLKFKHFDREYSFDIGGFTALTGCEWQIWDRNTQENLDGYHGAFGVINLMNQRKTFSTGLSKSFADLKPTANFLLWNSEISYDGINYVKDKATEYVLSETKVPQRQFITPDGYWGGFLARPEGIEGIINGNLISLKLRVSYGGSFYYYTITPDMWETVDYAYRNTALSALPIDKKDYHYFLIKIEDGPVIETGGTVIVPSITKNITTPTIGQSVTFTSTGCQSTAYTNKWYDTAEGNFIQNGLTLTVNAADGNGYYAKCVGVSASSTISNIIVFNIALPPPSGSITITEPSIIVTEPFYFTNGQPKSYYLNADGSFTNNLPVIYRSNTRSVSNYLQPTPRPVHSTIRMESGYSMTQDLVWLKNSKVKFGINLLRGGQLAWASLINATTNLVYNGYDGGFQVTLDAYQKRDLFTQNSKYSRFQHSDIYQFDNTPKPKNPDGSPAPNPNNIPQESSYNTTMGGDFNNNSQSLVYHYRDGNSYIVGVRPIFYTIDSEFSEVIIETKYTLEPDAISLRIEHKYISKRTDGQYEGSGFDGCASPACFLVKSLSKYRVDHEGTSLTGDLPIVDFGQPELGAQSNKKYLCVFNPNTNVSLGIYKIGIGSQFAHLKQFQITSDSSTEFGGGFTYVGFNTSFVASIIDPIPNRNSFEKTMVSYIMVGNHPDEIDTEANRLKILTGN